MPGVRGLAFDLLHFDLLHGTPTNPVVNGHRDGVIAFGVVVGGPDLDVPPSPHAPLAPSRRGSRPTTSTRS